jgi:acyl carrier protein
MGEKSLEELVELMIGVENELGIDIRFGLA